MYEEERDGSFNFALLMYEMNIQRAEAIDIHRFLGLGSSLIFAPCSLQS